MSKQERKIVNMAGVLMLGAISVMSKRLSTLKESIEASIKDEAYSQFVKEGRRVRGKPSAFTGEDGAVNALISLKTRGSNSPLNTDEIELLEEWGIPTDKVAAKTRLVINPEYANDEEKMEIFLTNVKSLIAAREIEDLPVDFITQEKREVQTLVSSEAFDALFRDIAPRTPLKKILQVIASVTIRTKTDEDKHDWKWAAAQVKKEA